MWAAASTPRYRNFRWCEQQQLAPVGRHGPLEVPQDVQAGEIDGANVFEVE
jgi:hypothetical protein